MALDKTFFEDLEARIPKGKVRTRFAPSPTGYMHVGNLRTALYPWLIASGGGCYGRDLQHHEGVPSGSR